MSSQRSRSGRGPNRNGQQGEEFQLWQQIRELARSIIENVNDSNDTVRKIEAQDNYMAQNRDTMNTESEEAILDGLFRKGVKLSEQQLPEIKKLMDQIKVLRALQKANEDAEAEAKSGMIGSSRSGGSLLPGSGRNASRSTSIREREREREREKDRERERETRDRDRERDRDPASLYDFDGGESPVPSPVGGHTRKLGGGGAAGSDRSGDRDASVKADSAEPQPPGSGGGGGGGPGSSSSAGGGGSFASASAAAAAAAATQRSKVIFIKGQDVAFKPKPQNSNDSPDWYLGKVQQVLGEGKSRRYKVKDEDPDVPPEQRTEYRTSASSMIPIPPHGQDLADLDKGKIVLALYPDSTTFYKAEVMTTDPPTGKVSLRFEGEETSGTLQLVDRRFVVEWRA